MQARLEALESGIDEDAFQVDDDDDEFELEPEVDDEASGAGLFSCYCSDVQVSQSDPCSCHRTVQIPKKECCQYKIFKLSWDTGSIKFHGLVGRVWDVREQNS